MPTVVDLRPAFLRTLRAEARSPKTVTAYSGDLNRFLSFLAEGGYGTEVADLTPRVLRRYLEWMTDQGWAGSTQARRMYAIRSFLSWCEVEEILVSNAASKVRLPQPRHTLPVPLTEPEYRQLLRAVDMHSGKLLLRDRALVRLLGDAGLRCAEVTALRWPHVDFGAHAIAVKKGKGEKDRVIPLLPELETALWEWLQSRLPLERQEAFVFPGRRREDLDPRSVHLRVQHLGELAGLPHSIHPHLLRHRFATQLLNTGASVREVQELMGHENLETTARYCHVSVTQLHAAIARLRSG